MLGLDPITAIANAASTIIDKIFPDAGEAQKAKLRIEEMKLNGELAAIAQENQLQIAQIEVNKEDAKSSNWIQANWRPAVGWIGAFSLGYAAILEPLARFVAQVGFGYTGAFPILDSTISMQILFGILGLGAYRSFDKMKGSSK